MTLTGHAHHFLSRLDRLSVPHLDVALSLYRDDDLLRHILKTARVPEGMERVALSLADPVKGPFIIVTRGGKFVTCLGEGMVASNLHVIPRGQLDTITENVTTWRERTDRFMKSRDNAGELMRALYERAQWLTREQFEGIAVWQPFMAVDLLKWMLEEFRAVDKMRGLLLREVPKSGKLHRRWDETLHALWCRMWTIGHLSVLAAMDGQSPYQALPAPARATIAELPYGRCSVSHGLIGNAIRGIWGAARLGAEVFATYKRENAKAYNVLELVETTLTLTTMGLRHPALRAEAKAALSPDAERPAGADHVLPLRKVLTQLFADEEAREPGALLGRFEAVGAELAVTLAKRSPPKSPYHFNVVADVPRDIRRGVVLLLDSSFQTEQRLIPEMILAVPWLAMAKPEELYLPSDYLASIRTPYDPAYALELLCADRSRVKVANAAAAKAQQPGLVRSAPCPCGSGKKYKRCCGAEER